MQETLHLSSSSAGAAPLPLKSPNFPSIARPKHLIFPPSISLPPPVKSPANQTVSPAVSESETSQTNEILLYLDSLGVDSFYCLHSHPPLISTTLAQIRSTVDFLLSLGITVLDLRRIFPMCPELLTSSTSATVIAATTFLLREVRVEAADLRYVIHRRPRLLTCSVERQLRPTLYFLQGTIGIEDVCKWTSLLSCSVESKFIPRIEYLQKLGFSYTNTIVMFRRFPSLFCYSIKENFEPKFDYFVVGMGRDLKELVAFPHYFSFSLENRIKPRHRMCVEKGVCLKLPTMLKLSEARFQERLEVCCSSSAPMRTSPLWSTSIYALDILIEKRITGFPAVDDDWKSVGVASDYDLLALDSISQQDFMFCSSYTTLVTPRGDDVRAALQIKAKLLKKCDHTPLLVAK